MPSSSYPDGLSSLIGAQETADCYSKLLEDTKTFFYVFPDSVPIYSAATEMADGFTSFNGTQKQNAVATLKQSQHCLLYKAANFPCYHYLYRLLVTKLIWRILILSVSALMGLNTATIQNQEKPALNGVWTPQGLLDTK